jgi:hypothetical protein
LVRNVHKNYNAGGAEKVSWAGQTAFHAEFIKKKMDTLDRRAHDFYVCSTHANGRAKILEELIHDCRGSPVDVGRPPGFSGGNSFGRPLVARAGYLLQAARNFLGSLPLELDKKSQNAIQPGGFVTAGHALKIIPPAIEESNRFIGYDRSLHYRLLFLFLE